VVGYKLAIVIPALNEEASIGGVVSQLLEYGVPIVIDDGSKDLTSVVASDAGARVIRHQTNKGYDAAINSGFACAEKLGFEIAITMDADGQHDKTMIPKFVEEIVGGADVVIGIRDFKPRIAERAFAFIAKTKWGIDDPLCGFKAYSIKTYQKLIQILYI
jgi:glycosyltransferase involved in cell wall biosynthesis